MFYGLFPFSFLGYAVIALVFMQITIMCVTVYLHRCQAHRSLDVHPALALFFRTWLWLNTGMLTKEWAAIHRKHHAKCETEEDPHSPHIVGLKTVLWHGAELYRLEAKDPETAERYGHGTPDDWIERNLFTKHSTLGLYSMFIINALLFGVPGIAIFAFQVMCIPFCAAGIVNGIGHYFGYRNFECKDRATNIIPWGIFIGGEELHNNHHSYPTSAKLSNKWWELDIGWLYIRIFSLLGLAKVKRVAPKPEIIKGKSSLDAEALSAIIANKIQVMTQYTKTVVLPVFNQARARLKTSTNYDSSLWRRLKSSIACEDSLVSEQAKYTLANFLSTGETPNVETVYEFRQRLQEIWAKTTASQKELLEALARWCQEAEATGIKSLTEFVSYLRGYSIAKMNTAI